VNAAIDRPAASKTDCNREAGRMGWISRVVGNILELIQSNLEVTGQSRCIFA
jgi:hypothetical protein